MVKYSEAACNLLREWFEAGRPAEWDLAPILADAVGESGLDDAKKLAAMRAGRMVYSPHRWEVRIFGDDDREIAYGMPPELGDHDWREAFGYAGEPGTYGEASVSVALPGHDVSTEPFSRRDVAEVLAMSEGENDGLNWLCVGRLRDGRWFALDAGCDYTGWD